MSCLPCLVLLPRRKQQHQDAVSCELYVAGRGVWAGTVLLQARVPAGGFNMSTLSCWRILSKRQPEHMSRKFILCDWVVRHLVLYLQSRLLRLERRLHAVQFQLLLHRRHFQGGVHCQRSVPCAKHKLQRLLLRPRLPGCRQRGLRGVCCQYVVLDGRAQHVSCEDMVASHVKPHVKLHLRSRIHRPRRAGVLCVRPWDVQAGKRKR